VRRLRSFLARHRLLALDTNVFVYHLEANPRYVEATGEVLRWVEQEGHGAVCSTITLAELLVAPYRKGDEGQVGLFWALLTTIPHLEWRAPDLLVADGAAKWRARYGLKMPDALIVSTALVAGATGLVTNDAGMRKVRELEVLVLDDAE